MASSGSVAIVTGAAQGIGYAISDLLLKEGYRVCLSDVNAEKGNESLAELRKTYGSDKSMFIECDVTSKANFEDVFTQTQKEFGRIDVVVNNAGIADSYNPERMVGINLMGPVYGSQLALKFMGTSNGGKGGIVVNVASIAGLVPFDKMPVYSATKHGIVGLTRSYGNEAHLDQHGVIFTAICPYFVRTPLLRSAKPVIPFEKTKLSVAILPEFVADGVLKLLRDKRNGSILATLPEGHKYVEIQDELKDIKL